MFYINFIVSIFVFIMTYPTSKELLTLLTFQLTPPLIMFTSHFRINILIFHLSPSFKEVCYFLLNNFLFFFFCLFFRSQLFLLFFIFIFTFSRLLGTHWKVIVKVWVVRIDTFGLFWPVTINIIILICFINKELLLLISIILLSGCIFLSWLIRI